MLETTRRYSQAHLLPQQNRRSSFALTQTRRHLTAFPEDPLTYLLNAVERACPYRLWESTPGSDGATLSSVIIKCGITDIKSRIPNLRNEP